MSQVEIWFGILTHKAHRGASFERTDDIKKAIEEFVSVYSSIEKPFAWRKREARITQLRNAIANSVAPF